MPRKQRFMSDVLRHLGLADSIDAEIDKALVSAARSFKERERIDPGPGVSLSLAALPGTGSRVGAAAQGQFPKGGLVKDILRSLGYKSFDDAAIQEALIQASRSLKERNGLDPGPSVKVQLSPTPRALE